MSYNVIKVNFWYAPNIAIPSYCTTTPVPIKIQAEASCTARDFFRSVLYVLADARHSRLDKHFSWIAAISRDRTLDPPIANYWKFELWWYFLPLCSISNIWILEAFLLDHVMLTSHEATLRHEQRVMKQRTKERAALINASYKKSNPVIFADMRRWRSSRGAWSGGAAANRRYSNATIPVYTDMMAATPSGRQNAHRIFGMYYNAIDLISCF